MGVKIQKIRDSGEGAEAAKLAAELSRLRQINEALCEDYNNRTAEVSRLRAELDEARSASLFDKACLQGEIRLTQAAVTRALAAEADNEVLRRLLKSALDHVSNEGDVTLLTMINAALGGQHGQ